VRGAAGGLCPGVENSPAAFRHGVEAYGTSRITDTVHEATRQVVLRERRRRLADNDLPDLSLAELERLRRAREP
jgi:hypothetical protein